MWVRIPPPVPASSSRPVPLIEERGDFFVLGCRLDSFSPAFHDMRFSPSHISPPIVPFFPRRRIGESYSIRRAEPLFGLAGRDAPVFLSAFPSRLAGRICLPLGSRSTLVLLSLCSPLSYPSNRLLAFLLASLSAVRLGVSPTIRFLIRPAGRMRIFRTLIRFHRRFRHVM